MTRRPRAVKKNRRWRPRRLVVEWLYHARRRLLAAVCGIGLSTSLWYGSPWALHAVKSHPYFTLTHIEVNGNRRITLSEVLRWAGVNQPASIWDAAPDLVRMRLQSHAWIRRVRVQREFPNRLGIELEERRPVAIVRLDQLNYVDRSGRILGPLRDGDSPDFPLITGLEEAKASGFTPVGVHRALRLLRLCQRLDCFDAISEVHVDQDRGITVFPLHPAAAVVLGWGGWREKLARSARVFAAWEGQVERLAAVDVSFRDMVVVKLRAERPAAGRSTKKGLRV
jgi:cell division protein FtsQ